MFCICIIAIDHIFVNFRFYDCVRYDLTSKCLFPSPIYIKKNPHDRHV